MLEYILLGREAFRSGAIRSHDSRGEGVRLLERDGGSFKPSLDLFFNQCDHANISHFVSQSPWLSLLPTRRLESCTSNEGGANYGFIRGKRERRCGIGRATVMLRGSISGRRCCEDVSAAQAAAMAVSFGAPSSTAAWRKGTAIAPRFCMVPAQGYVTVSHVAPWL
ncbi:hypothetical protein GJ744_003054 [Endocarpon pusillum]|uniref:Uncharacterized protein n=1 Tax=Endocarpon pusillum TaxID=364733 RepID=A0A8H7AB13_9EURO|nr:hypothetical protein GJ744_003054 [Endocarpon pusillum]